MELDLTREKAYWLGSFEPEVQSFLRGHVKPGDVVYDVGAHLGFFSLCAARLGARVFAFEISPANLPRLRRNVQLNELSITVVGAAVWSTDGGVGLAEGATDSEWAVTGPGTHPSVTLDAFAREHGAPQLVKIDVEGAEGHVLRGAADVLASRPVIVCEMHGADERDQVRAALGSFSVAQLGHEWRLAALP